MVSSRIIPALAVIIALGSGLLLPHGWGHAPVRSSDAKTRIGTFDSRAVAIAAARSGTTKQQVVELQKQLAAAEHDGDKDKAAEIKQRGAMLQTLRHLQGFSNAPIDDLLESVRDRLPGIAEHADVDVIASNLAYRSEVAEVVDVTDELVALFSPDDATLKIVAELRKQKPAAMLDILMHGD